MDQNKKTKKHSKTPHITLSVLGVLVIVAAVFLFTNNKNQPIKIKDNFSKNSMEKLYEINNEYQLISIKDLENPQDRSFYPTMIEADVLSIEKSTNHLGVITKIRTHENEPELLFSWQPKEPLDEKTLKALANEFEKIPEIEIAEPDQTIVFHEEISHDEIQTFRSKEIHSTQGESKSTSQGGSQTKVTNGGGITEEVALANDPPVIAIIDSGIYQYHEDFDEGRIYAEAGNNVNIWNFADNSNNINDEIGHGTHIAGIIYKNSKSPLIILSIINPQTLDSKLSYLISALKHAKKQKADIINLSLGITNDSKILHETVEDLHKDGVIMVVGAGNNGKQQKYYPAAYEEVIAIASSNQDHEKSVFSNYGEWIDYAAIGEDVMSYKNANTGYTYMTGTSQSAARATAIIADFIAKNGVADFEEIVDELDKIAIPFENLSSKYQNKVGKGILE